MKNKKYFIIKKNKFLGNYRYTIHNDTLYDMESAMRKILALDTLNEDRENTSYHFQEVDLNIVPNDEVKEEKDNQEEMPF